MHMNMQKKQSGAALVIGLVLLLVLTLLAVSGMNTATLEVQMAGNSQFAENAFQAAETGIDRALAIGGFNTALPIIVPLAPLPSGDMLTTVTTFDIATAVPDGGFSLGTGTGFQAFHFDIVSQATSARGATATNTQSFYIVGPGT